MPYLNIDKVPIPLGLGLAKPSFMPFIPVCCVILFLASGLAEFVAMLFGLETPLWGSLSVGCVATALAGYFYYATVSADWNNVSAELEEGECTKIEVKSDYCSSHFIGLDIETLVFDCGESTLILVGGWWKNRAKSIDWTGKFPSKFFTIHFLAGSKKIIKVEANGAPLGPIDYDPDKLYIDVALDEVADLIVLDIPLESLSFSSRKLL